MKTHSIEGTSSTQYRLSEVNADNVYIEIKEATHTSPRKEYILKMRNEEEIKYGNVEK